jgi:hypothetical protein
MLMNTSVVDEQTPCSGAIGMKILVVIGTVRDMGVERR